MNPPLTLSAAATELRRMLKAAGIGESAREARLMLRHAGFGDADQIARPDLPVASDIWSRLAEVARRRGAGEPLSRIRGQREFMGRDFIVTPAVLDPRPESEVLVEVALKHGAATRILDLGTGSGCLLVSLLAAWPDAIGVGIDLSPEALVVTRLNTARYQVDGRADLYPGNWYDALPDAVPFDLIVSNPPYIPSGEVAGLDPEVRLHDPLLALDGGVDGLDAYRFVFAGAAKFLKATGAVIVEIGEGQADDVVKIAENAGFLTVTTYLDVAGTVRVVKAMRG